MGNSPVCDRYSTRIRNEIGWLSEVIKAGVNAISKDIMGAFFTGLNNQAQSASSKMQIVYLVNLFESFMHDFIAEKDGLSESETNKKNFFTEYLKSERELWNDYCNKEDKAINTSTSFMNLRYSLFVINERYNIKYPSYLTSLVFELGSLRNCLVHYNGELFHEDKGGKYFIETLEKSLKHLEIDEKSKTIIGIKKSDKYFITLITQNLAEFIELCGGKIERHISKNIRD